MMQPEHAGLAELCRVTLERHESGLHSGERSSRMFAVGRTGRRNDGDAEGFRHAVDGENFAADRVPPLVDDGLGKALPSGEEVAHRSERRERPFAKREQAAIEGRNTEEPARLMLRNQRAYLLDIGPVGAQYGSRADRKRAKQAVFKPVSEKQA